MANSPHLGFPFLETAQAQKETTINQALALIDTCLNNGAIDRGIETPPVSPSEGDTYILGATPTGAWAGHASDIAYYYGGWKFIEPGEGLSLWVKDEDLVYYFNGSTWQAGVSAQNVPLMGINTTADSTNKLAVASDAVLFTAGASDDIQVKVNKTATGDSASYLFQTNFSGRAEFGLTGDDDFHFKVSPDGSAWHEAFVLTKDTGATAFKQVVTFEKFVKLPPSSELTIASGEVTVTKSSHKIDTESDDASDDLVTINGGAEGVILLIQPADDARTVVVKHGTGNIRTASGADVSLDSYGKTFLCHHDGTNWLQI